MHKLLKSYLRRLTNLSGNNRSLLLLRLISDQFIDLRDFNFLNGDNAFSIVENMIASKKVVLCPIQDSRDDDVNVVSRRLKKLQRVDKFILEERGSKDLYLGWPFVRGKLSDGTLIRCPLTFFPCEIVEESRNWVLKPRKDAELSLNKSFILAYSYFNQVEIGEELLERSLEDFEDDSQIFRTGLYQLFKESPIEINFNRDNFKDELIAFENFKKAQFEENEKEGELKLYPEAVLGIFPQAGSHLVPDYLDLIENSHIQDIEEFFAERSNLGEEQEAFRANSFYFLNQVKEERTFTPFKMDAFQENALKAAKKGTSVIVQGPPGTGKSQLICNLISDFIARGQKVLLVCQKRAALDVVYNRMGEKDMTDFIGLVHDFRDDKKPIYQKIAKQVDKIPEYKLKNNGLDAVHLERQFLRESRKIDQITEQLDEFKFALFDESECGTSVKELYLTSDRNGQVINIKQEYRFFHFDGLHEFIDKLKAYSVYAEDFGRSEYALFNRKSFKGYTLSDLQKIREAIEEIPEYQEQIASSLEEIVQSKLNLEDCLNILNKRNYLVDMLGILSKETVYNYFRHMAEYSDRETDHLWLSNVERITLDCFKGLGPEVSLPSDLLGKFQEALMRRMEARTGIMKLIKWRLFARDKYLIKRVLVSNNLKPNKKGLRALEEKVDNRLNLEHNLSKLKEAEWLSDIPEKYTLGEFQNWFYLQKLAIKAKIIFSGVRNFKEYFNPMKLDGDALRKKIEDMFVIITDVQHKMESWRIYLSENQITNIINNPQSTTRLISVLNQDFDALCEFDEVKDSFRSHEVQVADRLFDELGSYDQEKVVGLFNNSLRLAWIEHIETKYPILRSVSSLKFQRMESDLQNSVREKLKVSNDILLLKSRERTYENVEYNRLNNMVTYRDLYHQVTKKRRIWPLRKLMNNFSDELFELIPCWMASPESVSAIFPMRQMFDLVIFDEASQCFAERGIPAMYRGRQVVIAGDDKQLKPNDLYRVRWEEQTDDDPSLEVDSLLELANQYLMNVQLRGHYRSRSLDLIDFSNQHFYDGQLQMLPDSKIVNKQEPGINYIKVDGTWENNINDAEAVEVVRLVRTLIEKEPEKEIGVVTFNAKQQGHILDLLDEEAIKNGLVIPDSLFVKNIENVQGDEKDTIIFSTAYAPDKGGKMMMQFGSLNQAFGENRLNVAVTRAREKIVIVSSVLPNQLKVEDSKNEGPKLLKEYLKYAYEVSEGRYLPALPKQSGHSLEWYLKNKISTWSAEVFEAFKVENEMPFSDLTVSKNGHYIGLILTDDDLYYQSISIKDMHVYRPFTLSHKNWKFKGIFSREYWHDSEKIREGIAQFINKYATES
ncbi:MAG: AAA domain-containing protein [Bacteroidota bacterium]